ncbi:MAG: dTMP kinase [Candidatus Desulforudis sp.]|nr:dTMP kinase [Desulforudis sp.]
MRGAFIVFEGIDGVGKTTQLFTLFHELRGRSRKVVLTREPGGTPVGEAIRRVLLDAENQEMTPETEALLYAAARAQFVSKVVRPTLERGEVVLSDRFVDSSLAYQGYGRGLDLEKLAQVNMLATGGLRPDLTILLDMPVVTALGRLEVGRRDRLELEDTDFYDRVRRGYRRLASADPGRYLVLDADREVEVLAAAVMERVEVVLGLV